MRCGAVPGGGPGVVVPRGRCAALRAVSRVVQGRAVLRGACGVASRGACSALLWGACSAVPRGCRAMEHCGGCTVCATEDAASWYAGEHDSVAEV